MRSRLQQNWRHPSTEAVPGRDQDADAARRITPGATLTGTVRTALIYVAACNTVLILIPSREPSSSIAHFAEMARMFWGGRRAAGAAPGRHS